MATPCTLQHRSTELRTKHDALPSCSAQYCPVMHPVCKKGTFADDCKPEVASNAHKA